MNSLQSKAPIRINIVLKQYRSQALRFTNNSSKSFHAQSSIMVQAKYHAGQTVEYKPVGGRESNTSTSTGTIERVITEPTPAGSTGVTVKADPQHPRYEIKNNNTGKTSAVKEENIMKTL